MKTLLSRAALAAAAMALGLSGAYAANPATGTLAVTLNVTASCTVGSSSITFSQSPQQIGAVGQGSISVNCTPGVTYHIGLGSGLRSRQLQGPGGATVDYDLYSDESHSAFWYPGDLVDGQGSGSSQSIPVYINAHTSATTPVGTYTDNVQITVAY